MKSYFRLAIVLGTVAFSLLAQANYSAVAFEQGSGKQKEVYRFQLESAPVDGKDQIKSTWKDAEGNSVIEQTVILDGSKVVRDELIQKQTNQKGIVEVKDGKIFFTKEVDGKSTTKEETLKDTFVVSASFQRFVKDKWDTIVSGKDVEFRYGVWDRQETVGFEIFKIGEEKVGDQPAVVLKMKPSSFIIAALVKPIIFKFAADGSKLLEMNGRVAPKKKVGDSFKDLDAEVVYTYQ